MVGGTLANGGDEQSYVSDGNAEYEIDPTRELAGLESRRSTQASNRARYQRRLEGRVGLKASAFHSSRFATFSRKSARVSSSSGAKLPR